MFLRRCKTIFTLILLFSCALALAFRFKRTFNSDTSAVATGKYEIFGGDKPKPVSNISASFCSSISTVFTSYGLVYKINRVLASATGLTIRCCESGPPSVPLLNGKPFCTKVLPVFTEYGLRSYRLHGIAGEQSSSSQPAVELRVSSAVYLPNAYAPHWTSSAGWHFMFSLIGALNTYEQLVGNKTKNLLLVGGSAPVGHQSWLHTPFLAKAFTSSGGKGLKLFSPGISREYFTSSLYFGNLLFTFMAGKKRQRKVEGNFRERFYGSTKRIGTSSTASYRRAPLNRTLQLVTNSCPRDYSLSSDNVLVIQRRKSRTIEALHILLDSLEELNFKVRVVHMEDYTVMESLKIVSRYLFVLGVHGNGLTQTFCMRKRGLLIVLVPPVADVRQRKENPGYNTNHDVDSPHAYGYGAWAHIFGINSLVLELPYYPNVSGHWMKRNATINKSFAEKLAKRIQSYRKRAAFEHFA